MEKIVFVSREPANHEQLNALVERLFPECTVEIVAKAEAGLPPMHAPVGNEAVPYGGEPSPWETELYRHLKNYLSVSR